MWVIIVMFPLRWIKLDCEEKIYQCSYYNKKIKSCVFQPYCITHVMSWVGSPCEAAGPWVLAAGSEAVKTTWVCTVQYNWRKYGEENLDSGIRLRSYDLLNIVTGEACHFIHKFMFCSAARVWKLNTPAAEELQTRWPPAYTKIKENKLSQMG